MQKRARIHFACLSHALSFCCLVYASYAVCARYAGSLGGEVCGRQNTEGLCSCFHINEVIVQAKHTVFGLYADRFCEVLCRYGYGIAVYRYRKFRICEMVMLRCTEQRRSRRYDVSIDNQLIRQMNFQRILTVESRCGIHCPP